MEQIAPLVQTVFWVGLIAGIVWRFDKPIYDILVALQKRIEGGSTIKAGPFEISEQLKPQDPEIQKQKAASEVTELIQTETETKTALSTKEASVFRARYFLAEDLALRAVQAEYGATINRQVTAGADMGFDGALIINGQLHIIEVKFFSKRFRLEAIRSSLERIVSAVKRYGWRNVRIVLVLVSDGLLDVSAFYDRIQETIKSISVPVEVRWYFLDDLQQKFGVDAENSGK